MPILSGSAPRPKQVSMANTPAKTILQLIIRFISAGEIKKLESPNYFIVRAAPQEECPTGSQGWNRISREVSSARQLDVWENARLFAPEGTPLVKGL
jgi:hypothetical protein